MINTSETRSFGKHLLRALLVIATIGAGASAMVPDTRADESVHSSPDDPPAEIARLPRRHARPMSFVHGSFREGGVPLSYFKPGPGSDTDAEPGSGAIFACETIHPSDVHLRFGAGSFASSALGSSSSTRQGPF